MTSISPLSARFSSKSGIRIHKSGILTILLLLSTLPSQAAVIYSGLQNLSVAQDLGGLYLNVTLPGFSTNGGTQPGTWATAPWINPVFGGVSIGSSDLLRPNITGGSQVLNLAVNTVIDSSRTYAAGESGSTTHVGAGGTQFQIGAQGLLGFVMQTGTGGPLLYGWMRIIINNAGVGTIMDWAYDNTANTAIPAGFTGTTTVPEPGRALLSLLGLSAFLMRRRRR